MSARGLVRASERRIIHRLWPFPAAVVTFPLGWNAPSPGRATPSVLHAVAARLIKELAAKGGARRLKSPSAAPLPSEMI